MKTPKQSFFMGSVSKKTSLLKHFFLLFIILTIESLISILMAKQYSIDYVPFPILLIIFSIINIVIICIYTLIIKLTKTNISYSYTLMFGILLSIAGIIGNFLFYFDYFHVTGKAFYLTYGLFLLVHLLICLQKRNHSNEK
jgi:hypothetical protein